MAAPRSECRVGWRLNFNLSQLPALPPRHGWLSGNGLDVASSDSDVAELAVGELAELSDRIAIPAPGGELLGNRL